MPVALQSSDRSILQLLTEEDGNEGYYLRYEKGFSWPGGASGPTVGGGYDCGYSTAEQIEQEWSPYVDAARVAILKTAAGLTHAAGQAFVAQHRDAITITWAETLAQFKECELPKWEGVVRKYLPNTDKLSGDSFGALVSLTDNRGPSYDAAGDHYREMRNIKAHMAAEQFDLIPAEFLSMRRLWMPSTTDLYKRRTHESILFRDGLPNPPIAVKPAAPVVDHSIEALQSALNKLGADPQLDVDGENGPITKTAVRAFQKKAGIGVDGMAGDETWKALDAALAAPEK